MSGIQFHHYPNHLDDNGPTGYERTPQLPSEGESVYIRAAVTGSETLTLQMSVDGQNMPEVAGQFAREERGRRFFVFELGGFAYGNAVEYAFLAGGERSHAFAFDVCRETAVTSFRNVALVDGCLCLETGCAGLERLCLSFTEHGLMLSSECRPGRGVIETKDGILRYADTTSACAVLVRAETGELKILGADGKPKLLGARLFLRPTAKGLCGITMRYRTSATAVYGLGERFHGVNQIGQKLGCSVMERFTNQGKAAYFPIPFYCCDDGHGVFADTLCRSEFDFGCSEPGVFSVAVRVAEGETLPPLHVLLGTPKEMLQGFAALSGKPSLPPKWAFGVWISANRWSRQRHIEEQLQEMKAIGYPASVVVIEAWSDEATFTIWNDAAYDVKPGSDSFSAEDFRYSPAGRWPDPAGMIHQLHALGMKLVLWQIPVLKKLPAQEPRNLQHENDVKHAVENGLCAKDADGGAYTIPDFWFTGSNLPDFTQQKARDWWFGKRKYLLGMGVDGFKTDGGEFVYGDCAFADGSTETEMKNGFAASYLDAYAEFAGNERTLFSRAGCAGSQRHPFHWAGDQLSTWKELRSVLHAGLTLGMSGQPFWSFDIGGFAGPLPSAELYLRSTALAAFAPAMQWHSEPMGGQYAGTPGEDVNDRSPWNIARAAGDAAVLETSLYYA